MGHGSPQQQISSRDNYGIANSSIRRVDNMYRTTSCMESPTIDDHGSNTTQHLRSVSNTK